MSSLSNSNDINYFKIGSFVLVGLGLIIFAILVFGSEKFFEPVLYIETYFDESVQGISEGTPVKYRGLQIGNVKQIAFVEEIYESARNDLNRSIYVRLAITSKAFTRMSEQQSTELFKTEIQNGLRVKIVAQGLTGNNYLELDYVNPVIHKPTQFNWKPKYIYIPSITSTLNRLSESAQYIMNEFKRINFKETFDNIDTLVLTMTTFINQINNPLKETIQNFKVTSNDLHILSEQLKLNPSMMILGKAPPKLDPKKL